MLWKLVKCVKWLGLWMIWLVFVFNSAHCSMSTGTNEKNKIWEITFREFNYVWIDNDLFFLCNITACIWHNAFLVFIVRFSYAKFSCVTSTDYNCALNIDSCASNISNCCIIPYFSVIIYVNYIHYTYVSNISHWEVSKPVLKLPVF